MRISSIPYFDNPSYHYNGKELDMMSGLNNFDYGARQYYQVPVWDRVDPLCEEFYNIFPYAYCKGNPVNAVDVDGEFPLVVTGALAGAAINATIAACIIEQKICLVAYFRYYAKGVCYFG